MLPVVLYGCRTLTEERKQSALKRGPEKNIWGKRDEEGKLGRL